MTPLIPLGGMGGIPHAQNGWTQRKKRDKSGFHRYQSPSLYRTSREYDQ